MTFHCPIQHQEKSTAVYPPHFKVIYNSCAVCAPCLWREAAETHSSIILHTEGLVEGQRGQLNLDTLGHPHPYRKEKMGEKVILLLVS